MSEPLSSEPVEVTTNLKRGIQSDEGARLPLQACWMPSLGLRPRKPTRTEYVRGHTQFRMERSSVVMERFCTP